MSTRREVLIALGAGAVAAPCGSFTQQQNKVWRIGFLGAGYAARFASRLAAFKESLRTLGYVEGGNFVFEERWSDDNNARLPELAAELVRAKCDVIVTGGTPGSLALKAATTSIPIVMASSGDAVRAGLVASLARPGGNVTGLTFFGPELYAKRFELLKEAMPRVSVVAHLTNPGNVQYQKTFAEGLNAAATLKVKILNFEARTSNDFEAAFAAMAKARVEAVMVAQDNLFTTNHDRIAACRQVPVAIGRARGTRRSRRHARLRREHPRSVSPQRRVRRQNPERCEARRTAGGATNFVRARRQCETRQIIRHQNSEFDPCARDQGYRMIVWRGQNVFR
jgi:putative ABC transport system substrate-binding protein